MVAQQQSATTRMMELNVMRCSIICNEVPRNNQKAESSISDEGVRKTSNDDDCVDDDSVQLVESLKSIVVAEGLIASDDTMDNPVH